MASKMGKKRTSVDSHSFPSDWPIDSTDPSQEAEQSTLSPGPLLHASSGADVFIAKTASQKKTNPQHFLCLLPGNLQLNHSAKKSETLSQSQETDPAESDLEADDLSESGGVDKSQAKSAPRLAQIGQVEQLLTQPVLSLAIGPGDTSDHTTTLSFQGKHVASSSKFLVLSFQPKKKKQRVTVKHVFNSVIVFGDTVLKGPDAEAPATVASNEVEDASSPVSDLDHYGGSSRSKCAGASAKWIRKSLVKNGTAHISQSMETAESLDSDRDGSSVELFCGHQETIVPRRNSLSRQTKERRKTLAESDSDEDSDESTGNAEKEDSLDTASALVPPAQQRSSSAKIPPTKPTKTSSKRTRPNTRTRGDALESSDIELSSDSDRCDESPGHFDTTKPPRRKQDKSKVSNDSSIGSRLRKPRNEEIHVSSDSGSNFGSDASVDSFVPGKRSSRKPCRLQIGKSAKKDETMSDIPRSRKQPSGNGQATRSSKRKSVDRDDRSISPSQKRNADETKASVSSQQFHTDGGKKEPEAARQLAEKAGTSNGKVEGIDDQDCLGNRKASKRRSSVESRAPVSTADKKISQQDTFVSEPLGDGTVRQEILGSTDDRTVTPTRGAVASPSSTSLTSPGRKRRVSSERKRKRTLADFAAIDEDLGFSFLKSVKE